MNKTKRKKILNLYMRVVGLVILVILCVLVLEQCKNSILKNKVENISMETEKSQHEKLNKINRKVSEKLSTMTLEEKVAQLFFVSINQLDGQKDGSGVSEVNDSILNFLEIYPVGGVIYFADNIHSPSQLTEFNRELQKISSKGNGLPLFIAVDEEGGDVARVGNNENFNVQQYTSATEVGSSGNKKDTYEMGKTIGTYLKKYGFNVDFAPVADVMPQKEESYYIYGRSFGTNPDAVGEAVQGFIEGLHHHRILTAVKHFPGIGSTLMDTHHQDVVLDKTIDDIKNGDLIPFQYGIEANTDFIMVGHINLPEITNSSKPSSLSPEIITDLLRKDMGFEGLIITDALDMRAVTNTYSSKEAAVLSFTAGSDMLLELDNFEEAYDGILSSMQLGEISMERLDESVKRILTKKYLLAMY